MNYPAPSRGVDLALELVGVGVDLLLDQLVGTLHRLLELLLDLGLAEHDHGGAARLELVAELLQIAARDPLAQVPDQSAGAGADDRAADQRGRKHEPDDRADPGAGPGTVLRRLLGLGHPDLAIVLLADHRRVERPDRPRGMQVEHAS